MENIILESVVREVPRVPLGRAGEGGQDTRRVPCPAQCQWWCTEVSACGAVLPGVCGIDASVKLRACVRCGRGGILRLRGWELRQPPRASASCSLLLVLSG